MIAICLAPFWTAVEIQWPKGIENHQGILILTKSKQTRDITVYTYYRELNDIGIVCLE